MLMNRKYYTIDTSFNKEAAKRFAEKTDFMKIIQKCIKESEENMYNNPSTASLRVCGILNVASLQRKQMLMRQFYRT